MEIGKIALSFVILGILHHTLGNSEDEFRKLLRGMDPWIVNEIMGIAERSCQRNVGPKAFESWVNSTRKLEICISNYMMSGPPAPFLENFRAVMKCIDPQIESLESCLDPALRKIIDIIYKVVTEFTKFVQNEKENIDKIINHWPRDIAPCLLTKYRSLLACAEDPITISSATVVRQAIRLIHGQSGSTPSSIIGTDWSQSGCQLFETFQTCSVEQLNKCDDKLIAELVQRLFESINPGIGCKNSGK